MSITIKILPPKLRYPELPTGSMQYKCGLGEDFYDYFWKTLSESERDEMKQRFPDPKMPDLEFAQVDESYCHELQVWLHFWEPGGKPQYTLEQILDAYHFGEQLDFLFFYGANGNEYHVDASCLSQHFVAPFRREFAQMKVFRTAEHYMMHEKALLFDDAEIAEKILSCEKPVQAKRLGRKLRNYNEKTWNKLKHSVVLNGNYLKFMQNPYLINFLLSTGDKILVEASPLDTIWGIGKSAHDKNIKDPTTWRGRNMLGFALMEVRDELRRVWNGNPMRFEDTAALLLESYEERREQIRKTLS